MCDCQTINIIVNSKTKVYETIQCATCGKIFSIAEYKNNTFKTVNMLEREVN